MIDRYPPEIVARVIVGAVVALVLVVFAIMFWERLTSWWPFSAERRLERAEAALAHARSDAEARGLEVDGERAQAARARESAARSATVATATAETVNEARRAPDAQTPLDPDRLERLRGHDRRLCDVGRADCRPAAAGTGQ